MFELAYDCEGWKGAVAVAIAASDPFWGDVRDGSCEAFKREMSLTVSTCQC